MTPDVSFRIANFGHTAEQHRSQPLPFERKAQSLVKKRHCFEEYLKIHSKGRAKREAIVKDSGR